MTLASESDSTGRLPLPCASSWRKDRKACEYYQRVADRKQLKIACTAVGDVPPAWADRVAVAVIADNLLSNAVNFSKTGDTIEVQVMADPDGVVCTVRDHGPGLSEFEQAKFLQRSAPIGTAAENREPAGFGLRICNEFVDRMVSLPA